MANEGPTSGPDLQSLIRASMPQQAGGGTMYLFGGAKYEVNVGQGLAPQGAALIKADGTFKMGSQRREGLLDKIWKDIKGDGIMAGLKKVADAAPPQQAAFQQVNSITDITGSSHGLGGGVSIGPSVGGGGFTPDM